VSTLGWHDGGVDARSSPNPALVRVVDSHTAGEPTRVVVAGGPDLGEGSLADGRRRLERDHLDWCRAVVCEPRGHDAIVGALLLPPRSSAAIAGVIFFNTVGTLGMCGHGTIGLVETLRHMGALTPGRHVIETPAGDVEATLSDDGRVRVRNVPSRRTRADVDLDVPGLGRVRGDVAWGGNWFFLVHGERRDLTPEHLPRLTADAVAVRRALAAAGVTGDDGAEIDHVELFGPTPTADSRSFVLCPGHAYDRSPCGTGTSAKLACLHADGRLAPGRTWVQESVIGSRFEAVIDRVDDAGVWPVITGRAFVTAEATLLFDGDDPFRGGIPGGPTPRGDR
jgi:4-hydroxyproline epimerase